MVLETLLQRTCPIRISCDLIYKEVADEGFADTGHEARYEGMIEANNDMHNFWRLGALLGICSGLHGCYNQY